MMTVQINLPDEQAAAFTATATAQGLTLEEWISQKLMDLEDFSKPPQSPQEAMARILEIQKRVKPDPEGWTVHDYINYGRR